MKRVKATNCVFKNVNFKSVVLLFFRIYERVVDAPFMDIPEDTSLWLGQRNSAHGFFKVSTSPPEYINADACLDLSY